MDNGLRLRRLIILLAAVIFLVVVPGIGIAYILQHIGTLQGLDIHQIVGQNLPALALLGGPFVLLTIIGMLITVVFVPIIVVRYIAAGIGRIKLGKDDIYFIMALLFGIVALLIGHYWR